MTQRWDQAHLNMVTVFVFYILRQSFGRHYFFKIEITKDEKYTIHIREVRKLTETT